MYAILMRVEVDAVLSEQAETVKRKIQQAMRSAFHGAPYLIKFAVTPPTPMTKVIDPAQGAPLIVTP